MPKIKPREAIEDIMPYQPGKPIGEVQREFGLDEVLKLASNENELGPSPKALDAIREILTKIHRYPEGSGFYFVEGISEKYGFDFDQFILGNGANDLIELVVKTYVETDENVIYGFPSFIMYEIAVKMMGAEYRRIPLKNYAMDMETMLDAVDEKTKIVFIANPNNPTGTIVRHKELDEFVARIPDDVLVVLDEAYNDFVDDPDYPDSLQYVRDGKTVMVMRSLSKTYGLAGLRLGWAVADKEIIDAVHKIRQPFNANIIAQAAGVAALADEEHLLKSREMIIEGRDYLYEQLKRMGLDYVESQANFVLIDFKTDITELNLKLLRRGIVVRPMAGWGYTHSARVTVGTMEQNRQFVKVLKEVLKDG
ncbi:MAG: histidinol-phosphate transaminase [bacterium]|nr:histidinol-phosphate transaminase [bacterium]